MEEEVEGGRGGGRGAGEWMASEKGSEGRQVSSCLFLKEMPLAVYQSRVEKGIFD